MMLSAGIDAESGSQTSRAVSSCSRCEQSQRQVEAISKVVGASICKHCSPVDPGPSMSQSGKQSPLPTVCFKGRRYAAAAAM